MKYTTQRHITQDPDHINVHWDSLTICQLNCSYCYARNQYGEEWGKLANKQIIDAVIDALGRSTLSFNLGLLGGEPTLNPHYYYILDRLSTLEKFNKVYVVTNAEKDFTDHPYYEKLAFLFSYHPADCTNRDRFIANMKLMASRGYQTKVNVMLHHDKRLWPDIKDMIETCHTIPGMKIHPHFIYGKSIQNLFNYRKDFWDYFSFLKDTIPKELMYDNDLFNDYEVYGNKLTNFKGWSCYNNNYEIDVKGNVVKFCKDPLSGSNLIKDPDFFKNIERTVPMICPHNACNCDGLLKQLKIKNES
jgi:hypothetical protein